MAINCLDILAENIHFEHTAHLEAGRENQMHANRAGGLLLEARDIVGPDKWAEWVETNCKFPAATVDVYMCMAAEFLKSLRKK